jgi:uncharacterized membrane protein
MNHIIVSETSSNIRKAAREGLNKNWKLAMLTTILYFAVTMLPIMFSVLIFGEDFGQKIGNLYSIIVGGPFCFGFSYFILKLFRKQEAKPTDVFYGFDFFIKAFLLYIVTTIFIILWTMLFVIPGIIAAYRYRMAFFVLLDNPNLSTMEAINESKRLMKGNKGKLFLVDLSFIGWVILATLTVGIGFIALTPYMFMATVVFYELCNGNISPRSVEINYAYNENNKNAHNENSMLFNQNEAFNNSSRSANAENTVASSDVIDVADTVEINETSSNDSDS